jgi:hypothetical protein
MSESSRVKQAQSLKGRLEAFAKAAREKAMLLSGPAREELFKKARRAETAAHIDEWASSPGLQPPK